MHIFKKISLIIALVSSGVVFADDEIKIAAFLPIGATGDTERAIGESMGAAIKYAVDKRGGMVNGKKITIVTKDTKCDSKASSIEAAKFKKENIKYVIGFPCSSAFIPVMETLHSQDIVSMVFGTVDSITIHSNKDREYDGIFRAFPNNSQQVKIAIDDIVGKYKDKKIAVVSLDDTFSSLSSSAFKNAASNAKLKVVDTDVISKVNLDFRKAIDKIKTEGVEIVYYVGYVKDTKQFFELLSKEVPNAVKYGAENIPDVETSVKNIAYPALEDFSNTPQNVELTKLLDANKLYKGFYSYATYAAMNVLLDTMAEMKSESIISVRKHLHSKTFDTNLGKISFDENGDIKGIGYTLKYN